MFGIICPTKKHLTKIENMILPFLMKDSFRLFLTNKLSCFLKVLPDDSVHQELQTFSVKAR